MRVGRGLVARHSLLITYESALLSLCLARMRQRNSLDGRCSYVVVIGGDAAGDLRELGAYLSSLGVAKCEVIIVDGASEHGFARHRRVLCWVGRHVAARARHRNAAGA